MNVVDRDTRIGGAEDRFPLTRGSVIAAVRGDDTAARERRLCELNVMAQVRHVCEATVVQDTWAAGRALTVHGWIYGVEDGLLRDLGCTREGPRR